MRVLSLYKIIKFYLKIQMDKLYLDFYRVNQSHQLHGSKLKQMKMYGVYYTLIIIMKYIKIKYTQVITI